MQREYSFVTENVGLRHVRIPDATARLFVSASRRAHRAFDQAAGLRPWDLQALSKVPDVEWVDAKSPVRSLFYENEEYDGHPTPVFAYFASPATLTGDNAKNAKFPALVLLHGGGGTAFREWAELWAKRGYAAIAMDLAGHRPVEGKNPHPAENRVRLDDGGPNQGDDEKFGSIDKPASEQWPYHAVAAGLRAHSLIRSFAEVDPQRTAVTGISWGGYLTCIVAGVDSRFKAAVPVYGCGFLYEDMRARRLAKMSPSKRTWIQCGTPRSICRPFRCRFCSSTARTILLIRWVAIKRSFDAVPGTKQLRVSVNLPHSHPAGWAPPEIG